MKSPSLFSFFPFGVLLYFLLGYNPVSDNTTDGIGQSNAASNEFCLHDQAMENWLAQNPSNEAKLNGFEKDLREHILTLQNGGGNHAPMQFTLPVVVHIVHNNGPENITDAQVLQGMQDMNDAFANVGYYDQGTGLDMEIDFCLAKRDPNGNATTGITRDQSPLTSMNMGTDDIALKDLNRWDPLKYINIWLVGEIQGGVAGYAYFPTSHGGPEDGIVMESTYFGSAPSQSIVQSHEMGHYLGLYHTFQGGCTNNDCLTDGDRVCDTPPDQSTTWVPCTSTPNTCSTDTNSGFATDQNDMIWNYMDYSDFVCYSAFTQGQKDRAHFTVENIRQSLLDSDGCQDPCTSNITASFSASSTTINAGQTVTFTNSSSNATGYDWRVDGTNFSSATNPTYTFNSVGTFEVVLFATNADPNCLGTDTVTITVNCPITASFSGANLYPAVGETISFINTSTGATSFDWLMNGVSQSTATDFSFTFDISGTYTLCLDAANQFCDDTDCVTMFVFDEPGDSSCEGPFLKYFGEMGQREYGLNIIETADGNLLAAGGRGNSSLLILMTSDGEPIWEKTFNMTPGDDFIFDLFLDSEGRVLVAGRDQPTGPTTNFMFLYDIDNEDMLWSQLMPTPSNARIEKIAENPTNANYIIIGMAANTSSSEDVFISEIDRTTGNQVWLRTYNAGGTTETALNIEIENNAIYTSNVLRYGSLNQIRASITRFELDGTQTWTRNYYEPVTGNARQYMHDLEIINNEIYAISHGDLDGSSTVDFSAQLIKTNIDGEAQWAKNYSFGINSNSVQVRNLLEIPDGFIVQGFHNFNGVLNILFLRVDINGNPIWAKSIGGINEDASISSILHNQEIYFAGRSTNFDPNNDLIIGALDLDGNFANSECSFISDLEVFPEDINLPFDGQDNMQEVQVNYGFIDGPMGESSVNLPNTFFPDCECIETTSPTDCQSTFIKTFGLPNSEEDGWTITESDNGGFFMAGGSGNQSLLVKIDPIGTVAWAREFDLAPQNDFIRDIRLDSDGMLIGCGQGQTNGSNSGASFFFRYDHLADNFLWVKNMNTPNLSRQTNILESAPGGNFLAFGQFAAQPGNAGCDGSVTELDRNTGDAVWMRSYHLGSCETFSKTIISNGDIFTTGRYNFAGGGTNKMRGGMSRLDMAGNEIWSRLYLVPVNPNNARIYSNGILEDNGSIVSISSGDNVGSSTSNVNFHMYATDLNGDIQWAKNMNVVGGNDERSREIVNLPDGYLAMGSYLSPTLGRQIFLVKTDKLGEILWSRQYGGTADEEAFGLLVNNGFIHFIGRSGTGTAGEFFLARLTLEGETFDPCDQIMDLDMTSADFPNPYDGSHPLTVSNENYPLINFASTATEVDVVETPICESPCVEICDNGVDDDGDDYIDCYDPDCPCNTDDCAVTDIDQNFATQLAWQSTVNQVSVDGTPIVANLDPQVDSIAEIVVITSTSNASGNLSPNLLIFKGDGSNAANPKSLPIQGGYDIYSAVNPAIGDVDRDGVPDLVMVSGDRRVRVYTGYDVNANPPMTEWIVSPDLADHRNYKPYLADFNGDGISEVYVGDDVYQFDFTQNPPTLEKELNGGSSIGMNFYGLYQQPNCSPLAVDILQPQHCNGDPDCNGLELVAGNVIYSVDLWTNDGDGFEIKIQRDINLFGGLLEYRDGYTSVADVNLDGILDVIVSGGRTMGGSTANGIYVWDRNGVLGWFPHLPPLANPNRSGALVCVANVYDDTQNGAAVDFPEMIVTSQGYLNCYNLNADALGQPEGAWWILNTTDLSGATGATVFDFNADGIEEIIYRDEDNLRIMYGGNAPFPTGVDTERNWETFTCGSGTFEEHPVVANVDDDLQAEIIVTGYTFAGTNTPAGDYRGRLRVFEADLIAGDPWMSARPIWNQYNYFVVNVNDDLSLPAQQQLHQLEFPDIGSGFRPLNKFVAQVPLLNNDFQPYLPVPDATMSVESVDCNADSLTVSFTVCNEGDDLLPAETPVTFYLGDPTVTAVGVHHTVLLGVDILPDSCFSLTANIPTANSIIHVVVNDDGSTPTPYNLGIDFPVTSIPECNYLNNPASFVFDYTPPPPPDLGPDLSFCNNGVANLDAGPGWDTYEWQDGFPDQVYTAWEEGEYWVTVTDSCGSVFSDTILIEMDTSMQFDLGPGATICPGDTITFDVPGFDDYEWVPDYEIDCTNCPQVNVTPLVDTTYVLVATDEDGCVSVDSFVVEIEGEAEISDTIQICLGDSILLFGNYETTPGEYVGTIPNPGGCDTILTVTLETLPLIEAVDSIQICAGDSVIIFGNYQSAPGEYTGIVNSTVGCDTSLTITLEVAPFIEAVDTAQVCLGDSILIFGNYQSIPGNYIDTIPGIIGCDTIMTITLESLPLAEVTDTVQVCLGDSILLFGNYESVAGDYTGIVNSTVGCDTSLTVTLEVVPFIEAVDTTQVCLGDSVLVFGNYQSMPGNYIDTIPGIVGCDTIMTITLETLPLVEAVDTVQVCLGDSILLFGNYESVAGDYTGIVSSTIGCDTFMTVTLEVVPLIVAVDTLQICAGDSALIFGAWENIPGNYTDTLSSTTSCDTLMTVSLLVEPLPTLAQTIEICAGDSVLIFGNYESQLGDYTGILPSMSGCDTLLTVTLEYFPEIIWEGTSFPSCPNQNNGYVELSIISGTPPFTYQWSTGDTTLNVTGLAPGFHSLTVTDANGCMAADGVIIMEIPVGSINFETEDVSCFGFSDGSLSITDFPQGSVFSLDGAFFSTDTLFENMPAGAYTLFVETPAGCLIEQEITIGQPPELFVNLPPDVTIELGDSVQLSAQVSTLDSLGYVWTPTSWLSCIDCADPWAAPFETTEYVLAITTAEGCTDDDDILVTVIRPLNVYVPNGFSPNGDGINDNFTIYGGTGFAQIKRLLIFDRWGELVFEGENFPPNSPEFGWDGTFRNEEMDPAVFAWFAEIEMVDGQVQLLEGDLTLLR